MSLQCDTNCIFVPFPCAYWGQTDLTESFFRDRLFQQLLVVSAALYIRQLFVLKD